MIGRWRSRGVQKGQVGIQEVEQGGREGMLRGEAVFKGKASAVSERCDFRDHAARLARRAGAFKVSVCSSKSLLMGRKRRAGGREIGEHTRSLLHERRAW